jgi:hypothetical protein
LVQKAITVADDADLFAGVTYKLRDIAQLEPALGADLTQLEQRVAAIRQKANIVKPAEILPDLTAALKQLQQVRARATHGHAKFLLQQKEVDFQEAARLSAGLVFDVLAVDETVVPGQQFNVTASIINGGPYTFQNVAVTFDLPAGWTAVPQAAPAAGGGGGRGGRGGAGGQRGAAPGAAAAPVQPGVVVPGQKYDQVYEVRVPANTAFTQPYWLREPRKGDRFVWPAGSPASMPFDPPLLLTHASVTYDGVALAMERPAEFRSTDRMYGEQRAQIKAVPALSVRLTPEVAVIPIGGDRKKEFTVTIENQSTAAVDGEVRLVTPNGWTVTPAAQPVKFSRQGEKASVQFNVTAPATAGDFTVRAIAKVGTQEYTTGYTVVAYPHIETHYLYSPAESKAEVFDVKTGISSLGYIEGVGDTVPDALKQLGIGVTMLSAQDLASGDLSRFRTIVLGVRAYQAREDLRTYNKRLLDYVSNGGNLVVQYNRSEDVGNVQYGPFPFTINNSDRITKEDAPVKILQPDSAVFNVPNKITQADFDGWVQERGTYFLRTFDPQYTPLLESGDPGEQPLRGGLVTAKYGKGTYTYTGYVFFRELPAGIKGAYRLFANLVSLEN